jgi:glycosyltransferase involved in cell wall biosynthesis
MKLSIAICTHNEGHYIDNLLNKINSIIHNNIEVLLVDDYSTDITTLNILEKYDWITVYKHELNGDFASHKNFMNSKCNGDFILNLDADELLSTDLITQIPLIVESNPNVDAYWFPRVNTVDGLTLKHVQQWGWVITSIPEFTKTESTNCVTAEFYEFLIAYNLIYKEEDGFVYYYEPIIQWPDPQMRLYKNSPNIRWTGKVHERLEGFENFTNFPMSTEYAIIHRKEIQRQEQQNLHYSTIK